MIVFDLCCDAGHVFEAWFGSTADYDSQRERGLVTCALCGSGAVTKAAMAPAVPAKGNAREVARPTGRAVPMQAGGPDPAQMKAMLAAMAEVQSKMLEGSEHVGKRFAEEARAIHDGAAEERVIHGQATPDEARALVEDGIQVAPLPFPVLPREQLQ